MRLTSFAIASVTALALAGCVVVPTVPVTSPTTGGAANTNPLEQQLNNRFIRSDVFAGQLMSNGFVEGNHDLFGRGGNWYFRGANLCLNFGLNVEQCGRAEIRNGVLFHNVAGGTIGYDVQ